MLEKRDVKYNIYVIAAISLAAIALRFAFFDYASPDYNNFLLPWMSELREGGFLALKTTSSNYNLPYLYLLALLSYIPAPDLILIKLLSIAFDFAIAFTMMGLVSDGEKGSYKPLIVFAATLLFPTFWLNSAVWAQCDSIYASFCLLSYANALKGKPARSVLYAGIALAFKLQAAFFLPVFGVLWIFKKVKIWHAVLFPLPYLITSLPAILLGWPVSRILGIYSDQVGLYSDYLTLNAPSVFALLQKPPKHPFFEFGLAVTGLFVLFILILAFVKRHVADDKLISAFALATCMGVVWLLPTMHERYYYLAEVFVILFVALNTKRWYIAALVLFGSLAGYHAYLVLGTLSDKLWLAALIMLAALVGTVWSIVKYKKKQLTHPVL